MLRRDEIATPTSCLNNAADDEPIFVLKSTDETAPDTVRHWARMYVIAKGGHAQMSERQIAKWKEALALADQMDQWRASRSDSGQ